jgi:hypothetical protein
VVHVAISHFHVTALQNSAFLLALSNALISDGEINLQAKWHDEHTFRQTNCI